MRCKKTTILFSVIISILLITSVNVYAERGKDDIATGLEEFSSMKGTVIIKGYSEIGSVTGLNGVIEINSNEIINVNTGDKKYGIKFKVKTKGKRERDNRAYVDYEEIDSLIKGLEYISKIDKSATKLNSFEAKYNTLGHLNFTTFSSARGILLAVSCGRIGKVDIYLKYSSINEIKELIKKAKQAIDSIK